MKDIKVNLEINKEKFKKKLGIKDGKDGVDGKDGSNGSPDTGIEIVDKINVLEPIPSQQIDAIHIKNLSSITTLRGTSGGSGGPTDRLTSATTAGGTTLILTDDTYNQTLTGDTGKLTIMSPALDRTTVSVLSPSGANVLYLTTTEGLTAGQLLLINYGGATAEGVTILAVFPTYVTTTVNMLQNHAVGEVVRPIAQYGTTIDTTTEYQYDSLAVSGPLRIRSGGKTIASFVVSSEYADGFAKAGSLCVRGINLRNEAPVQQALIYATSFLNNGRTVGMTAISGLFNPAANHSSGVSFSGLSFGLLSGGVASGSLGSFRGAEVFIDFPSSDVTSGNLNALNVYIRSNSSISSKTYTTPLRCGNFTWLSGGNYYCVWPQIDGLLVNMNISGDYMSITQHCGLHIEDTIGTTAYGSYSTGSAYVYGILVEGTADGVTGTWDANFASNAVQIADDKKLYIGGSKTAYGVDYFLKNASGTLDLVTTTGSGVRIATGTTQKLAFYGTTPIVQVTTGVAAASFTANAGTNVNDASTFDGYTIKQVVKALRNLGLLA